jgi:hypothetical protein
VVCERFAQKHILTPPFFITALTQAKERGSHRWRALKVVYYSLRLMKEYK